MTLDLDELTRGWDCPSGEVRARTVVGRDGQELIQLRLDLGLLQMFPAGRPDGHRYHGLPDTYEYIVHELRVGGEQLERGDWQELQRELQQIGYRRLALTTIAEDLLQQNNSEEAQRFLAAALGDIEACLSRVRLLVEHDLSPPEAMTHEPALLFDQARLRTQLSVIEGRFEEAVEQAEEGARQLCALLADLDGEDEPPEEDPGVRHLRDLARQLRREYGISQTLRERLQEALASEDFEAAARLRDALQERSRSTTVEPPDRSAHP